MSKRERSQNEILVLKGVNLVDYYNTLIVPLGKASGRNFQPMSESRNSGLCPVHTTDTDPSFHWWKAKNIFHCFGCGFSGDVIRTHIQIRRQYYGENLTVQQAVAQLAGIFGIELVAEGDVVKSPFERAREVLFDKSQYKVPKGQFSLAEFRELNYKVKSSNYPLDVKLQNYEHLDLVASVALSMTSQ